MRMKGKGQGGEGGAEVPGARWAQGTTAGAVDKIFQDFKE